MRRGRPIPAIMLVLALAACAGGGAYPSSVDPSVPPANAVSASPGTRPASTGLTMASPTATPVFVAQPGAGIATDQPCTAVVPVGDGIARTGFALHELPALVLDAADLDAPATGWFDDVVASGFTDNKELVEWGDVLAGDPCAAFATTGRITGYASGWTDESNRRMGSAVHLFATDDGAHAAFSWLLEALPGPASWGDGQGGTITREASALTPLPGTGEEASLLVVRTSRDLRSWAVLRIGQLVGTVWRTGPRPDGVVPSGATLVPAAAALAKRMHDAPRTGTPLDAAIVMSAPVDHSAWGDAYASLAWDWWFGGSWTIDELATNATNPEDERAAIARTGLLESFVAMYGRNPDSPEEGIERVAARITVFRDADGAHAKMKDSLRAATTESIAPSDPADRFTIDGIEGAVGTVRPTAAAYEDTRVTFVRETMLVTVFIHDLEHRDQRAEVSRVARLQDERLRAILGGG